MTRRPKPNPAVPLDSLEPPTRFYVAAIPELRGTLLQLSSGGAMVSMRRLYSTEDPTQGGERETRCTISRATMVVPITSTRKARA